MRDQVSTTQRERAGRFRKAQVITDQQSDTTDRGVDRDERIGPRRNEAIDTEKRQVRLVVCGQQPFRTNEERAVAQLVAVARKHAADGVNTQAGALLLEHIERWAGDLLRRRLGLVV